jgi:hypothetical protein
MKFCISGLFFGLIIGVSTVLGQTPEPSTGLPASAAPGSYGTHCNLFYLTSSDQETLPFNEHCFVVDEYSLSNSRYFRVIGPIQDQVDLFRHYPWAINFYLPVVEGAERLQVKTPEDLGQPNRNMDKGSFFLTVSDYRKYTRYDNLPKDIQFAAVSGKGKITEFTPRSREMSYPEYALQMDVEVRRVMEKEGKYEFVGPEITLRMVLRVEELD